MEDKIDIHGLERGYDRAVASLMKDQALDEKSRELIRQICLGLQTRQNTQGKSQEKNRQIKNSKIHLHPQNHLKMAGETIR